jgi:hypothetical protein
MLPFIKFNFFLSMSALQCYRQPLVNPLVHYVEADEKELLVGVYTLSWCKTIKPPH